MSRFYLAPESEAMFRRVSHSRVISHVAKKCECGKQTTVKDLTQYGHCVSCQKAAAKQAPKITFVTSSPDRLLPDNDTRRFSVFHSAWTKARTA